MKDGLDYAEMLGLEVSSCDVTIKPKKTKRKKDVIGDVITSRKKKRISTTIIRRSKFPKKRTRKKKENSGSTLFTPRAWRCFCSW